MSNDMSQFHQVFFDEAGEHLAEMESLLLKLDVERPDLEMLNAIFRAAHSIKGGAGTFGFQDMAGVTHELETLLDRLRKQELRPTVAMVDAFLDASDVLTRQLEGHREAVPFEGEEIAEVRARLQDLSSTETPSSSAAETETEAEAADPGFGFFPDAPGTEGMSGVGESADSGDPGYGFFEPSPGSPGQRARRPAESAAEAQQGLGGRRKVAADSSIRVSVEKVDELINLVGELVITHAMLAESGARLDPVQHERILDGLSSLERNSRDLQQAVMSIRMLPISFVFNRFPRVVRDTAAAMHKQVRLTLVGEDTELDKGLIERLADPLNHLVRNSIDHGIEHPEQRRAVGKPESGEITLRASHQGGSIVIEVSDDGAGLNRERLLAKAVQRGMVLPENPSDKDVWSLIFAAGFSTAERVTDISGRGVGMDVVRRNIEGMNGRVEIDSVPGQGTRISIRLPLTLAILDGMSVRLGEELYILPVTAIRESIQPRPEQFKHVAAKGRVLQVGSEYLPLIVLRDVFGLGGAQVEAGIVVIVDTVDGPAALAVDELVAQHQVVIKSLETNYRKVGGVSGATIMGDGRVALILDADELLRLNQAARVSAGSVAELKR